VRYPEYVGTVDPHYPCTGSGRYRLGDRLRSNNGASHVTRPQSIFVRPDSPLPPLRRQVPQDGQVVRRDRILQMSFVSWTREDDLFNEGRIIRRWRTHREERIARGRLSWRPLLYLALTIEPLGLADRGVI
jgi:hypothetical protein